MSETMAAYVGMSPAKREYWNGVIAGIRSDRKMRVSRPAKAEPVINQPAPVVEPQPVPEPTKPKPKPVRWHVIAGNQTRALISELKYVALAGDRVKADYLSAELEDLTSAYIDPLYEPDPELCALKLTGTERRMLCLLHSRPCGSLFNRDAMLSSLYYDKPNPPEPKIIDVFIHKLRKKLKGTRFDIETVWGVGYRFIESSTQGASPQALP